MKNELRSNRAFAEQNKTAHIAVSRMSIGADERSRTSDLLITNQLLYQLSYISERPYSIKNFRLGQLADFAKEDGWPLSVRIAFGYSA